MAIAESLDYEPREVDWPTTPFLVEFFELVICHYPLSKRDVAEAIEFIGTACNDGDWTRGDQTPRYGNYAELYVFMAGLTDQQAEAFELLHAKMPYRAFLQTPYWKIVSTYVKLMRSTCQLCDVGMAEHVHHRTYLHRGYEWRYLDDLVSLCAKCHARHHGKVGVR